MMKRAFRADHELALDDAVVLCWFEERVLPHWALDALAARAIGRAHGRKIESRMGRHSHSREQQKQLMADARCFALVNEMRRGRAESRRGEDAFTAAGKKLHLDRETLRKAYYRARRRRANRSFYISWLYLDQAECIIDEFWNLNSPQ